MQRHRWTVLAAAIVVATAMSGAAPGRARAATTITVTTTTDERNTDGDCSLREAVRAANTDTAVDACPAGSGTDTIRVPAGTYTLNNASGTDATDVGSLKIRDDVSIVGAGRATTYITGGGTDRVIRVESSRRLWLSRLAITGGKGRGAGGGILGGIVTATHVAISDNQVTTRPERYQSEPTGLGGGIAAGSLVLTDSEVTGNSAVFGGGIGVLDGMAVIRRSRIAHNRATLHGAGLHVRRMDEPALALIELYDSVVEANTANDPAYNDDTHRQITTAGGMTVVNASARIARSTFSGNLAGTGSGLSIHDSDVRITDSTIVGNGGTGRFGGRGGGLTISTSTVVIRNSTLSGNSSVSGAAHISGLYRAEVRLANTIVAHPLNGPSCDVMTLVSEGHNLDWDPIASSRCSGGGTGDRVGDPAFPRSSVSGALLSPLPNGGPTPTLALGPNSAALDAGNGCGPDQRGVPRPQGAGCDIGAYERAVCGGWLVNVVGTPAADRITGDAGTQVVLALGGNDVIDTQGGDDRVCAGDGNDVVRPGAGNDWIAAGLGTDRLDLTAAAAGVTVDLRAGTSTGSTEGNDSVFGFENATGSAHRDIVRGTAGPNRITGGEGNDTLEGRASNDVLLGEGGNDTINGGDGTDTCSQGAGTGSVTNCEP